MPSILWRTRKLSRQLVIVAIALLAMLAFVSYPNAYAWSSSPQITFSDDGSGSKILTIQFNFSQMSNPPTSSHFPIAFQVRTSTDGSSWTELDPVSISPPTTTVFTETYNLGSVSGTIQVQARLQCVIHGWSEWGPDPAVPVPEFPFATTAVTSVVLLMAFFLFRRKQQTKPV
jgi:hypothetical protein